MDCDRARLAAADPTYMPFTTRAKDWWYWRPAPQDVAAGFTGKATRLPGRAGDGRDAERAMVAQDLTRELLRWRSGAVAADVTPHTWGWVIDRYRRDPESTYRDLKPNTRRSYDALLDRWRASVGKVFLAETDFVTLRRWQRTMQDKGRSDHYIAAMFTNLRIVATYGSLISAKGAKDVRGILQAMRFTAGPKRTVTASRDQVMAVVAAADADGERGFALGILLQWWTGLRAVDVRGQHLGDDHRWADGLTWDMIDMPILRKTPSKTAKSMPEPLEFDLSSMPDVIARLDAIPPLQRVGPVIRQNNGRTFTARLWAAFWRRYAKKAGVPDAVQAMDLRSGAATEARRLGASVTDLRDLLQHADSATTQRYLRERTDSANRVIALRTGRQPE